MTLQRVWNNFSTPAGPRRSIPSWPSCPLWPNNWTTSVGEWGSMWLETTAIWDLMLVYISFFSKLQSSFFTVMIFSVSTATLLWLAIGLNPSALLNRVSTNILMFLSKSLQAVGLWWSQLYCCLDHFGLLFYFLTKFLALLINYLQLCFYILVMLWSVIKNVVHHFCTFSESFFTDFFGIGTFTFPFFSDCYAYLQMSVLWLSSTLFHHFVLYDTLRAWGYDSLPRRQQNTDG